MQRNAGLLAKQVRLAEASQAANNKQLVANLLAGRLTDWIDG